jgi:hypothetical protein
LADQPGWAIEPLDRPLDVNLAQEGLQWEHHLRIALREAVPYRSLSSRRQVLAVPWGRPVDGVEYQAEGSQLQSRLWVTMPEHRLLIVGDGAEDQSQIAPWASAVAKASLGLADQHPDFRWAAVIGPTPSPHSYALGLLEPATVGPLQIRPGGVQLTEYLPSRSSLFSRGVFWSWPAIVEGTTRGFNWRAASQAATRQLVRLCALLSVCWGRAWQIRQGPVDAGESSLVIPEFAAFEEHPKTSSEVHRAAVAVPAWASDAWETLAGDRAATNALTAHYEGLLVRDDHPSLALLAFVAATEAVGRMRHPTARPTERFRRALRLVASEPEVEVLWRAYLARNETVHEAVIHGGEFAWGSPSLPSFFGLDPLSQFELEVVGQLDRLSRRLIHLVLKGELAAAEPLPTPEGDPFEAWPKGLIAQAALVEGVEIGP